MTRTASVTLTLAAITYLHVVFGEQMPKMAALQSPERYALWVARPVNLFARLTSPLIRLMNGSSFVFLRWAGYKPTGPAGHIHTLDELSLLVEDTEEAGHLDSDYAEFVMNVFELSDKKVADVMVPRDKVEGLTLGMPPDRVLEAVRQGAHTRMPVFDPTGDKVVGIVNTKDLFYLFSLNGVVVLEDAMYDATYLPPDEPVRTALRLFKKTKHPMAVVRDDHKTVLGIITLEDVLEEIVGDIEDEHDDPERRLELAKRARKTGYVPRSLLGRSPNPKQ
jgi:CBS domain containing-hemolysin-like protein